MVCVCMCCVPIPGPPTNGQHIVSPQSPTSTRETAAGAARHRKRENRKRKEKKQGINSNKTPSFSLSHFLRRVISAMVSYHFILPKRHPITVSLQKGKNKRVETTLTYEQHWTERNGKKKSQPRGPSTTHQRNPPAIENQKETFFVVTSSRIRNGQSINTPDLTGNTRTRKEKKAERREESGEKKKRVEKTGNNPPSPPQGRLSPRRVQDKCPGRTKPSQASRSRGKSALRSGSPRFVLS
ncbi:hypothetical protein B0T19DRAFT_431255, partial [Cercophora scortea]